MNENGYTREYRQACILRRTSRRLHALASRTFSARTGWHADVATDYWHRADDCDEQAERLDPTAERPFWED